MQKIFDDFLNKKITSKELLLKLNRIYKYICHTDTDRKDFNKLVEDIQLIISDTTGKDQYEDILIVFHQYLDNREIKKDKITSNWKKIEN